MNRVPLSQVCEYSEDTISISKLNLKNFISTDNLIPNRGGIVEAVNLPPANSCSKFSKNEILISNIRPYFKKIWYAQFDGGCSADVLVLKMKNPKFDSKFVYYNLFQDLFFKHQMTGSKGSKMPRGDKDQIMTFEIPVFEKSYQKRIAEILTTLDEKISLNNKINTELEAMAKTIYNYWFVQFDFLNESGKPYKASGGEMEWSEELKKEIPKGWEMKKVGEYADVRKGDLITAKEANEGEIKVVAAGIDFSYTHTEYNRERNTITISGSGANAGFINFWREPIYASDCITVRGKTDTETLLLLYYLKFIQIQILNKATGSAQPHVYPDDIKNLNYVIPDSSAVEMFERVIIPLNNQIANNLKQNQELIRLRDFLLPLLMNGQVKVR